MRLPPLPCSRRHLRARSSGVPVSGSLPPVLLGTQKPSILTCEDGLPTLSGVPEAARRLRDGRRLRVNGEEDILQFLEERR
jgi:hypothetical protein